MIERIKHIASNPKSIEILLISMFLVLPFGSNIFSFSIGFMTVYPYLILLGILSVLGIFHIKKISSKIEKWFLIFLLFWIGYSFILLNKSNGIQDAIIDIRSLTLMFLTSWVVLWTKSIFGRKKWKKSLNFCFLVIYFLLLFFAFFENIMGIHFTGVFIENINTFYPTADVAFAPVFLFDNPNNLTAYLLLLSMLIILTSNKIKKQPLLILLLIVSNLIISVFSDSKTGIFTCALMLVAFLILYLKNIITKISKSNKKYYILSVIVLFLLIYIQKDKTYFGALWNKKEVKLNAKDGESILTKSGIYLILTKDVNDKMIDSLTQHHKSKSVRYSLLLNGAELAQESNYTGVGAGQFRYIHKQKKNKYYTKTIISPHFWLIEIVAQFGILILILYLSFFLWIVYLSIRFYRINPFLSGVILISIPVFFLASIMPSSFLILDINWVFVAVLVGIISSYKKQIL